MYAVVEMFVDIGVVSKEVGGETGLYSPTEVQVIFEMPQLLFQLQRADNEWLSTRGDWRRLVQNEK